MEILTAYFLFVWSEWHWLSGSGIDEMKIALSEDFGIGMWCHWEDLIKRLDYVLEQLEQGCEFLYRCNPSIKEDTFIRIAKTGYGELKEILLEVDGKVTESLTRMSPQLGHPSKHTVTNSHKCT